MKGPIESARTREYPYVISRDDRLLLRSGLIVANESFAHYQPGQPLCHIAPGILDVEGRVTPSGRSAILEAERIKAVSARERRCVVWGPDDCTWIAPDGSCHADTRIPVADHTLDPYWYGSLPFGAEDCWTIELPRGHEPPFLCIVPIDARRVEIVAGDPVVLGGFEEPAHAGERDPAAPYVGADDRFMPPKMFRGQPVTGVDQWTLMGPVQPKGEGIVLRDPWPDEFRAACEKIARIRLTDAQADEAWRVVSRERRRLAPVGALEAV